VLSQRQTDHTRMSRLVPTMLVTAGKMMLVAARTVMTVELVMVVEPVMAAAKLMLVVATSSAMVAR
jgi:hypothetical protein